jgi:hypothetical protein
MYNKKINDNNNNNNNNKIKISNRLRRFVV